MRLVFDLEADGLIRQATRMWILAAYDLDSGEMLYWEENDMGWKSVLNEADLIIGHNILGYDVPLLKKLFDYDLPKTVTAHDTLIMSQLLDYRRFGYKGHSLAEWGEYFDQPKVAHDDWSQYSPEMKHRCLSDVKLNVRVYDKLIKEYRRLVERSPLVKTYMRAEHAVTKWQSTAQLHGWQFDVDSALILADKLEAEMLKAKDALEWKLGMKAVAVDKCKGIIDVKSPKWTMLGCYNAHTANWFGIDPWNGYYDEDEDDKDERVVVGPYCRVKFEKLKLSSSADVKIFLYRHGWEPSEWNVKRQPDGSFKNTSPKITEDDLELLGGDGQLYTEYNSASSRFSILLTWLNNVDSNGRLHGDSMSIGTPSMRMRHSIIVNVPSGDSRWGKEMRELFICPSGWKLVGCDSKGNQARGLAHYLGDEEFIDIILNKDVHIYNAGKLIDVLNEMEVEHDFTPETLRPKAKRILYAFLFGASGKKLWSYIFGTPSVQQGNKLKKGFIKAVPGFKDLVDKLEKIYGSTSKNGYGYIPSLAGNRIYVDSFHKLLVYLLQACEKITCATAVMLTMEELERAEIPYVPLIMMHDEEDFMVPEEHSERAKEIGVKSFKEGAELYDITIMGGDGKVGDTWYDIH